MLKQAFEKFGGLLIEKAKAAVFAVKKNAGPVLRITGATAAGVGAYLADESSSNAQASADFDSEINDRESAQVTPIALAANMFPNPAAPNRFDMSFSALQPDQ